jgi:hypothetical protein
VATQITPYLHLTEAIPGSNEPFSTAVVNANWDAIDTFASNTNTRVGSLETWRTTVTPNLATGLIPSGTAAERDTYWGVPGTALEKVTLANKGARWFNTDKGYMERFYTAVEDPAVTVGYKSWMARATAGWKPEGEGLIPINLPTPTLVPTGATLVQVNGNTLSIGNASNVTKISFDGVFTDDFNTYVMEWNLFGQTQQGYLTATMRTNGVDVTTNSYSRQAWSAVGTVQSASSSADTKALLSATVASGYAGYTRFLDPTAAARVTQIMTDSWRGDSMGKTSTTVLAAAHDGFSLFSGSGFAFTGEFKLYGLGGGHR